MSRKQLPEKITITPAHFEVAYDECEKHNIKDLPNIFYQIDSLCKHCVLNVAFREIVEGSFEIRGNSLIHSEGWRLSLNHKMIETVVPSFDDNVLAGTRVIPTESQTFNILETSWTPKYGNLGE